MNTIAQSVQSFASSVNGVAQAGVNLYAGFTRIIDSVAVIDRANLVVEKSARTVSTAEDDLNTAISKFGVNSDQVTKAGNDLAIAQDSLQVSIERAKTAADNQQIMILQFATSVIPTIISAAANFGTAMEAMGIATTVGLGPIGAVIAAVGALGMAIAYFASHWTPTLHDMSGEIATMKLKTDLLIASGNQTIEKIKEMSTPAGKLKAAYLEWADSMTQTNKSWVDDLAGVTEKYNILKAQSSGTFASMATDYWNAFSGGNLDLATGFLESIKTKFELTTGDVEGLLEEFKASLSIIPQSIEEQLVGKAQKDLETFQNCVSGKMATITGNSKEAWDTLVTDTNDLIKNGLVGQAQANIKAFVDCSTGKQIGMVDLIKSSLTDLQKAYDADVAARLAAVASGDQNEINLLDAKIAEIKRKMTQLNIWLQDAYATIPEVVSPLETALASVQNLKRMLYVPTMAEGGIVTRPSLIMAGEEGPEAIIPLDRGGVGTTVQITGPLLVVEGSVDRRTADYVISKVKTLLNNVIMEPTSNGTFATHKRIRLR